MFEESAGSSNPIFPRAQRIKPEADDLTVARDHLDAGDLIAGAVYIRAAYENCLRNICRKHNVCVPFKPNPKEVKVEHLWQAILKFQEKEIAEGKGEFIDPDLIPKINAIRSAVLNRLAHSGSSSLTTKELRAALQTISDIRKSKIPFK